MSDTIFTKIINKEIPADIVYEDDLCLAFKDISPQAPVHLLVIPKKPLVSLIESTSEDSAVLGHMMHKTAEIAETAGVGDAYRVVVNNGAKAGQSVFHIHLHILGGRLFTWPPG